MRRMAGFVAMFLLAVGLLIGGVLWVLTTAFGQSWLTAGLALLLVIVFANVVGRTIRGARLAIAPLGDLIEASARVEAGDFATRVDERGPREVRALARAFNAMSERLEENEGARRRLLADVSHELRTPLTIIEGTIEGIVEGLYPADQGTLERVLVETRQLERLIEDLRTLSLADAGALALRREPTDLGALVAEIVAGLMPQAAVAGVALEADTEATLPEIDLDPLRVRQVIANLIANAIRHTPHGGSVTASVRALPAGQSVSVVDTGEGMSAEDAARAFDRFWRSPGSSGAGLGLAIVRDLVAAHGGSVELQSAPGAGTRVLCRFPA
jgi:signal transduction histidine kinase